MMITSKKAQVRQESAVKCKGLKTVVLKAKDCTPRYIGNVKLHDMCDLKCEGRDQRERQNTILGRGHLNLLQTKCDCT